MKRPFALALLVPLVLLISGPAPLRAAEPDGALTDSAVTVSGRKGLWDDHSNLKITVSQTKDLVNQGVEVTWTGGTPTPDGTFYKNYLQMMQCWGPDPNAENFRDTCQFGMKTITDYSRLGLGYNTFQRRLLRSGAYADPKETLPTTSALVPFRSVTGETATNEDEVKGHFGPETTNEVPYARTAADGTGRFTVEVQNSTQSPSLGCGDPVAGSATAGRPCWLVIVPRGAHNPTGGDVGNSPNRPLNGSALSPTWFADRIVVPLEFQRVGSFCPLNQKERQTVGSELISEAIQSWQPALCANSGPVFGFSPGGDAEAGIYIKNPGLGAPSIGFVSEPVQRSETDPPIVHAPVALSAAVIALTIDTNVDTGVKHPLAGREIRDLKLTPRLLAKLLTQSYFADVPNGRAVEHVKDNPQSIRHDKEFLDLNPAFATMAQNFKPNGLMVVGGNSAMARQVWEYVLADDEARAWLAGKPDDQGPGKPGMVVNPNYRDVFADGLAPESFPKSDPTCVTPDLGGDPPPWCSLDLRPYQGSMQAAARQTLRSDAGVKISWTDNGDGTWAYKTDAPMVVGQRFGLAITDSASAARFNLPVASMRNRAGEFVAPTSLGVLRGVDAMDPTATDGVVRTNPKKQVRSAYPLTMLTYAAINMSQEQAARDDDAVFLRYAVGTGQQAGVQRGQLPRGYEPLPEHLRRQTLAAADTVKAGLPPAPEESEDPDESGGDVGDIGDDDTTGDIPDPVTAPDPGSRPSLAPDAGLAPSGSPSGRTPQLVARPTGGRDAGLFGDLLPALLILGALCAVAGPVLLRLDRRRGNRSPG